MSREQRLERRDLGRITAFTDGVMAVAITLLVLNIEVPQVPKGDNAALAHELRDLIPSVGSYALSFALVGRYWVVHHRLFETLRSFDTWLMTLNLVFLALIALVPFSTDLQDQYTDVPIAVSVFSATLGLAAFSHWLMTRHSIRAGLIKDEYVGDIERFGGGLAFGFTLIFLAAAGVAFISTLAAQLMWLSSFVLRHPIRRLARSR